jgi:hypothetical protein
MVRTDKVILGLALGLGCVGSSGLAYAYSAAGDRLFPSTILLPQLSPGDEFYLEFDTRPLTGGTGNPSRQTDFSATYGKMITENLGINFGETYSVINQDGAGNLYGFQNPDGEIKYEAVDDAVHEFIMSVGIDREFGGSGAMRVGAAFEGATTPALYLGKGLGDLDIGYLRPLAVTSYFGLQISDAPPRPNLALNGFVVEYSIPYLESKVQSFNLPDMVRHLTPIIEFLFTTPAGKSYGLAPTGMIAPGVSYAGEGWELAIEALVPTNRTTGKGIGVTAQLHIALDYLFPDSIGKPIFR